MKWQKGESSIYYKLHEEYITLHSKSNEDGLHPFLQVTNKARLERIEKQLTGLEQESAPPDDDVEPRAPPGTQSRNLSITGSENRSAKRSIFDSDDVACAPDEEEINLMSSSIWTM